MRENDLLEAYRHESFQAIRKDRGEWGKIHSEEYLGKHLRSFLSKEIISAAKGAKLDADHAGSRKLGERSDQNAFLESGIQPAGTGQPYAGYLPPGVGEWLDGHRKILRTVKRDPLEEGDLCFGDDHKELDAGCGHVRVTNEGTEQDDLLDLGIL
jgi:hypothetical protein